MKLHRTKAIAGMMLKIWITGHRQEQAREWMANQKMKGS